MASTRGSRDPGGEGAGSRARTKRAAAAAVSRAAAAAVLFAAVLDS